MSIKYSLAEQRCRQAQYNQKVRQFNRACDENEGFNVHETTRLEWKGSSYLLYFLMNGREKHVNIIEQCKEHCGRLTSEVRQKIEAAMPPTIAVFTTVSTYYKAGLPHNFGGYRYLFSVDDANLAEWLDNI